MTNTQGIDYNIFDMQQIATITGKMQLTVPIRVAQKIGLKTGDKVEVSDSKGKIVITPVRFLIEELAGSLPIPKKWQGKAIEQIIEDAKTEHFVKKSK